MVLSVQFQNKLFYGQCFFDSTQNEVKTSIGPKHFFEQEKFIIATKNSNKSK